MTPFEPKEILRILAECRVEYVVIGGIAAALHGSNLRTDDIDICPSRDPGNLERLAAALKRLEARVRTPDAPDGLPFACDAQFLANVGILNLVTSFGDFDLSFEPQGTDGFEDLRQHMVYYEIVGVKVPVASLADVIRSKEAANRDKDHRHLPVLRMLLQELQHREQSSESADKP